ncbi:hypothetical protein [Sphingomonas sp. VDB2]|uniref:hypothetical protein n=1 Tax=Sphingomonas sp. VDB2 TaxID=3228751 RepID=UPI003A80C637
MTKVKFVQTSDHLFYKRMMDATSKTVIAYCRSNNFEYESYTGIKFGDMPWHAAYNRIAQLKEILSRGYDGWVFYLDADAYIADLGFDLRNFLADKAHFAGIFAGYHSPDVSYTINSGGFALNFAHPIARQLVMDYFLSLERIGKEEFSRSLIWGEDIPEDQLMLHLMLKDYVEERHLEPHFMFQLPDQSHVNNGPFIKQILRSHIGDFESRCAYIEDEVEKVLSGVGYPALSAPGIYIPAKHEVIRSQIARKTDCGLSVDGQVGTLCFGPYIALAPGTYLARAFGRVRSLPRGGRLHIQGDVVCDHGRNVLAEGENRLEQEGYGILMSLPFQLSERADALEFRLNMLDPAGLDLHALQFLPVRE